ncbi:helix-turn-helix domain-containing protein [Dongshaea marina]|uniref:helix-turn-helix domain-containing protein n=1 Tax=Dongshaea marina TaxID=2047966 RepID=UPI00131ED6F7|nr:AraC family transcriptional regulator [Dongshaea marina]
MSVSPLMRELTVEFCHFETEYDEMAHEGRLVAVLLDQLNFLQEIPASLPLPRDKRLLALCEFIQQNLESNLSKEELGSMFGLSGRSVSRLFQEQTGISFVKWRQRSRMIEAIERLEKGLSVTEVASACGYESLSAFVAIFKRILGITPGHYLARHD